MDRQMALSVFKTLTDKGSFIAAASVLDISRPVASRIVQDRESLLCVLLHHTTRHLALTAVVKSSIDR